MAQKRWDHEEPRFMGGKQRPVSFSPMSAAKAVRYEPTPCRNGFHYVPDWWGLTEFG